MTMTAREAVTSRNLLDVLKKHISFTQGAVITTVPRGDLQIAQLANVAEPFLKAYADGLHLEDAGTWQAVLQNKALRGSEAFGSEEAFTRGAYFRNLLEPSGLAYAAMAPLSAPVLDGYPGAVHLYRTREQGDFTAEEIRTLAETVKKLDEQVVESRGSRRAGCRPRPAGIDRPQAHLLVMAGDFRALYPSNAAHELDSGLLRRMSEQARHQQHALNGHAFNACRVQLPDSHGDQWPFRVISYKKYPAIGAGAFTVFCLQPDCCEWGVIKPADFGADPELSRLIPALKFMQQEFQRGPSLGEIAATVSLSPFHFHRRFTELLGLTPKQYMLACQIHDAKVDLLMGEKELVQIAKECGFAHQSHFTSRFKQATGLTPTRWRRMAQQRENASNN